MDEERKRIMAEIQSKISASADESSSNPWRFKSAKEAFSNMDQYVRDSPASAKSAGLPSNPPPMPEPLPVQPGPISYVQFTDPQSGSFTVDVPRGWNVQGGLAHPMPGDRRIWMAVSSADGISIFCDPSFPQNLCHFPGQAEGQFARMAAGGQLLNLRPSAEVVADFYLKNFVSGHLGPLTPLQRRPRPEMVELLKSQFRQNGVQIGYRWQMNCLETIYQFMQGTQPRVLSLLSTTVFTGDYAMGMWATWDANVYLYIAPPHLAQRAEEVRYRMRASLQFTPRMMQIYQQDEAIITAQGQAANAAQWEWFRGREAAHQAQVAFGDAIVKNFWDQQQANDSMLRGWEHNQAVNDHLAQNFSDAIMDRQRLEDVSEGKSYEAPSGYNYYWRDQQTDKIYGTNTSDPPDLTRNYTQLKKL